MRLLFCLLLASTASSQESREESLSHPGEYPSPPSEYPSLPPNDSLDRHLARIAIARAEEAVSATDFWHRCIPRVQVGATFGAHGVLFPDLAGGYLIPKDSYRMTIALSPFELLDESRHTQALLQLDEARTRHSLLIRKQSEARLLLLRKLAGLTQELALARERMELTKLLLEYYELLFKQGKAEFHTLTRTRLEAVRMKSGLLELERQVREIGSLVQ